ncbi:helix-turn-helix domain-containing protein [Gallibacterium anatis]|uniref:helix-turn-helix domain-containing protein n=1 Tax=Gallibacterium anatis TaxID=750 RepID=UPI002232516E|nr:helix-turn-helix domain-containing protein [Gallibacterium anatis]UZD16762.1 helix-turn-helix domain-containing protein [Gallibacterium anatis]WAX72369.1 helix-turn-helix domain-containing protein [Gallibacterium anatis]
MLQISDFLKSERERLGLTQEEIASKCGVSKRTYIYYEQGERVPNTDFLAALTQIGGDVMYVLSGIRGAAQLSSLENMVLKLFNSLDERRKLEVIGILNDLKNNNKDINIIQQAIITKNQIIEIK